MYLVSIYFDENTNEKIQRWINKVAEKTGNTFMTDGKVPPHITVAAFETKEEQKAIQLLESCIQDMRQGNLKWVTIGQLLPYVIYISPVLNQYLHEMSIKLYESLQQENDIKISQYYKPFQWLPHTTIAKTLTKEQMRMAFELMQNHFEVFEGTVVKVGLAKPNPHRDIKVWDLKK